MSAKQTSNAAVITFPKAGASSGGTPLTHFGIGTDASGAGTLLYRKQLTNAIPVTANVTQPQFAIGALVITLGTDVTDILTELWEKHIFQNANVANIGDGTGLRGSPTAGSLYISLHSADPGAAGDQTTSEASYTNYARQGVARSAAGWTVA